MELDTNNKNNNSIDMNDNIYIYIIHKNIPKMITFENLTFKIYKELEFVKQKNMFGQDDINNIYFNIGYIKIIPFYDLKFLNINTDNVNTDNVNTDNVNTENVNTENVNTYNISTNNNTVNEISLTNVNIVNEISNNEFSNNENTIDNIINNINTNNENTTYHHIINNNLSNNVETTNVETNNVETTNLETNNLETNNVETNNVETTNVETNNVETNNVETNNVETTNVETNNVETNNVESTDDNTEYLYILRNGYNYNYAHNYLNSINNSIYENDLYLLSIYNSKKIKLFSIFKDRNNYNNFNYKVNYYHNNKMVETEINILTYDLWQVIHKVVSECYGKIIENRVNTIFCTFNVKEDEIKYKE